MTNCRRIISLLAVLALTSGCASWSGLHSKTSIDAGQAFLLGGAQAGRFRATVKNIGAVPVSVLVESGGLRRPVIVLAPDSTVEAEFQIREMAVFSNSSNIRALIRVDIRGGDSRNLGMRYDTPAPAR